MAKHSLTKEILENGAPEQASGTRCILEEYLSQLNSIHAAGAGVPEVTYYPALSNLFNAVGKALKPKVRCVMGLKNMGAGWPDGGLFTANQFQHQADGTPKTGQLPARGAIEAKGTKPDVQSIAESQQVKGYLNTYGIVLVTNLREFLIVERGENGQPVERESFALAENERTFWQDKARHHRATAEEKGAQFIEFIKRCCLHSAPLATPKAVAWFLASYARDALFRVERQKELPALQDIRSALEESLGMKFTADKGEHFFRSTLVQTLFYGIFSAWVRWHKDNPGSKTKFDWRSAQWSLYVPSIGTLYSEIAKREKLDPLGLVEVLDWAADVLGRVEWGTFFNYIEHEHTVQYFYEPFLEAYDPALRKEYGVWYTPREIAKYQVARVDQVLREELGVDDGLADPRVFVLDPCCGTGTYLVEVLNTIAATLRDKGGDALVASDLKTAAMTRVFGFEIMPAPYVVAHLQLGLMLQTLGTPLSQKNGKQERVRVYLTNALTGWGSSEDSKQQVTFWPELRQERDAARHVKRKDTILVVLGNPPYNAFGGVSPQEEQGLVELYKTNLNKSVAEGGWGIKKFNLDDFYVRFFRLAERRIVENQPVRKGVVSFISNHSWISEPSFVVLRQHLLESFDKFWVDNLHGNRKITEYAPDGKTSETIFAISGFSVGIQQGVATSLWVKTGKPRKAASQVWFRDDLNSAKAKDRRQQLLDSLKAKNFATAYKLADPRPENRFSFRPEEVTEDYAAWPKMIDLCEVAPSNGLMEKRGGALIDVERDALEARMRDYFDAGLSWEEYKARQMALTENAARFNAKKARAKAVGTELFDAERLRRYVLRPFDTRWCYYTPVRPVWNEPRPTLWRQCFDGNAFVLSRMNPAKNPEGVPMYFCRGLSDDHSLAPDAACFALWLPAHTSAGGSGLFPGGEPFANLSKSARAYLAELGIEKPDADAETAGLIWMHALAIGYSPAYLIENAHGIRRDWPRIPLPADRKALEASATLGEQIAALLDTEADVPGVTCGKIAPLLKNVGPITKTGGGQLDAAGNDLAVTAGWGHFGKPGIVMPAKGRLAKRQYDQNEAKAIEAEATARGMSPAEVRRLLGENTCDVYLNGAAYWRNIPLNVWEYYIGGYQVVKKWLSYREEGILGRALKPDEAREVTNMARRLAAIILMQPALDENYQKVKEAAFDWTRLTA